MDRIAASKDAFLAYNILYYPLFADSKSAAFEGIVPSDASLAKALTVQENLQTTPYALTQRSIASLALAYEVLERTGLREGLLDPGADVRSFVPDCGRPLYPDFPSQVLAMSEEDYRLDQARHYFSTYGVELIFGLMGIPVEVNEGWRPQGGTQKRFTDAPLVEKHLLDVLFSPAEMLQVVARDVARPSRMPEAACSLLVDLVEQLGAADLPPFAFHENMMEVVATAAKKGSRTLCDVILAVAGHPGDVFKAISWLRQEHGAKHLTTAQKKGFCRALESFEYASIAQNLAELSREGLEDAYMLSIARFGGEKLTRALKAVRAKEVLSFNAQVERAWLDRTDPRALVALYARRPGVLLRSATRLIKHGIDPQLVEQALVDHAEQLSAVTLVTLLSKRGRALIELCDRYYLSGFDDHGDLIPRPRLMVDDRSWERFQEMLRPVLSAKLATMRTPIRGKRVYFANSPFSITGSVLMPNAAQNGMGAYPPVGMAYDVPVDKTIRFFTFWDDRRRRVDVDEHFYGLTTTGERIHIGWYDDFRGSGLVMSGDVTDSRDSAEYLDVDMAAALQAGVLGLVQLNHIYSGADDWSDIATCYSGALIVGSTSPDYALYDPRNVLFHDDIKAKGRGMLYAYIDVPGHFVRILRGEYGYLTDFTLAEYLDTLLKAQGCTAVETPEEADCVITIGRDDTDFGCETHCLIDEGFFLG